MYRLIYIILLFSFASLYANDTINRVYVDSKTYEYYLGTHWKPLIKLGSLANKNDIDFFYLQLRMGTAYFYRQNFRTASVYFEKALEKNPEYEYALEMLYYCYLYSGEIIKLHELAQKIDNDLLSKITKKASPGFSSVYLESAYIPESQYTDFPINNETSSDIIQDYIQYKDQLHLSTGFSFFINNKSNVTLAYSRLQQNKMKEIDLENEIFQPSLNTSQNQLYIKNTFQISKKLQLIGAFHYLNINTNIAEIISNEGEYETTNFREYDTVINLVPVHVDVYDTLRGIRNISTDNLLYSRPLKSPNFQKTEFLAGYFLNFQSKNHPEKL